MRASLQEQECQLCVVLLPCHQLVGLDVTFPDSLKLARQFVWTVLCRQRTVGSKKPHRLIDEIHVESTLYAEAELLSETVGYLYGVCHVL